MPWLILALAVGGLWWWSRSAPGGGGSSPSAPPPAIPTAPTAPNQPPPPFVWQTIQPSGSDYNITTGNRYAILASVSKNYTTQEMADYFAKDWQITYMWEYGQPTRGQFAIDDTLSGLSPDPNSNHRWVYFEANRTGPTDTFGKSSPWPTTIYEIQWVLEAVPNPALGGS